MSEKKFEFKAEIKKLLNILSKSLYKHKEIFLRELVSNSADAMKKMQFILLQNQDVVSPDLENKIEIHFDETLKIITVRDTGVGMKKEELIENLGTIAGSGSQKFLESLEKDSASEIDLDIIGQFGVGFYSVFMVADKVEVRTKSYDKNEPAYQWISDGSGEFEISEIDKEDRGTEVTVYLNDEEKEYLNQYRLESIVKKYSNFISVPIYVIDDKKEEEKEAEDEKKAEEDETKKDEASGEEKDKEEPEEEKKPEPVNEIRPLWKRNKSEITDEDYKNFYHYVSQRYDDYLEVINYKADGRIQFRSIMYIPETRSQDLLRPEIEYGLDLYSKNILIMKNCKDLIPQWMRFVKGIVDSEDIPLNVSRDTIQTNRVIIKLEKLLVKKFIRELENLVKEEEKYPKFWKQFGLFIKEGIISDQVYRDQLMPLMRFPTQDSDKMIGLDEYIANMKEGQTEIYYLVGENLELMKNSPHIGYYNQNGFSVALFDEPVDNFLMMNVPEYKKSVGEGDEAKEVSYKFVPIDTAEKKEEEDKDKKEDDKEKEKKEEVKETDAEKKFLEFVKATLGDKIVDAEMSNRLYGNSCRLANPAGGMSSSMQRAMRFWTANAGTENSFQVPRKIFEFNSEHPIVKSLVDLHEKEPENGKLRPIIHQLFENCLLSEGDLPNPSKIVPRLNQLIEMLITGKDDVPGPKEDEPVAKVNIDGDVSAATDEVDFVDDDEDDEEVSEEKSE